MKIFFAGAERFLDILIDNGAKNLLFSAYYLIKDKGTEKLYKAREAGCTIFLDSGAHTFHKLGGLFWGKKRKSEIRLNRKELEKEILKYQEKYINFLIKNRKAIDIAIELDVAVVTDWNFQIKLKDNFKQAGTTITEVWHQKVTPDPENEWIDMCRRNSNGLIAIEGTRSIGEYNAKLKVAERFNTKVHGFALTREEYMLKLPFYSIDSTSWLSGGRYGTTFFACNKFRSEDKMFRRKIKNHLIERGIDYKKIENDEYREVHKADLKYWLEFEKFIHSRSKKYWN